MPSSNPALKPTAPLHQYDLELFADYYQFYLQDEGADSDLSDAWSDEATDRLLAVAPGMIGVGTARNMHVPVRIQILEYEPPTDFAEFDQVIECSLEVPSGRIVAAGCTDYFPEARRIEVPVGLYRVRVGFSNLKSLSADGLDGNDSYYLQLWQAPPIEVLILKKRAI